MATTAALPAQAAHHKSNSSKSPKSSSKTASHNHHLSGDSDSSRHHQALVKAGTVKFRSEPNSKSHTSALLDEGRSARVVGRNGDWVRLRLDSGREGWVRHDLVDIAKSSSRDENGGDSRHNRKHSHTEVADSGASRRSRHGHIVTSIADHGSHSSSHQASRSSHHTATVVALADTHPHQVTEIADTTAPGDVVPAGLDDSNPGSSRLIDRALSYRGTPYRMGATGNGAFDCSGFTQYLFGSEGTSIPRTAAEQYAHATPIEKGDLQPGDLVFFKNTYKHGVSHVGIYIGNNSFVHASSGRGRGVTVSRLDEAYYTIHWAGARRPR